MAIGELASSLPIVRGLMDFVFPPLCVGCGQFCEQRVPLCGECLRRIQTYDSAFCLTCRQMLGDIAECPACGDRAFFLFAYGNYVDPLKEIIAHFKFKGITRPIPLLSELLVAKFRDAIASFEADALVPIPLYPSREHDRGYNQAEKIALALSEQLDIPVDLQILIRTKKRREQARLSDHERERNIKGVFEIIADAEPGETVILVDDVVTGGHTVAEARKVLESAGFRVPAVIALAHGL